MATARHDSDRNPRGLPQLQDVGRPALPALLTHVAFAAGGRTEPPGLGHFFKAQRKGRRKAGPGLLIGELADDGREGESSTPAR